jgi:hypothetical protein
MFLVELEPGREALYESVDALASAIRRGDVGPNSRIFHRASSSWVSITVHPEFRRVAAERASPPLPPLARKRWTFYSAEPESREGEEALAEAPVEESRAHAAPDADQRRSGWRAALSRAFRHHQPPR